MGMSVEEFYDMIPKHFFIKMDGFYELEQLRDRNEWERVRWQTAWLINIQLKRGKTLKLQDFIRFDWEKVNKKGNKKMKNRAEFIKKQEDHGN